MWFRSKTSVCVFRVQSTVLSVETSRTVTSAWIVVPAVWRRISRQCGSTATPRDTVCHATPTARCREWISHTHAHNHTVQCTHMWMLSHAAFIYFSCTVMDERGCPVDTRTGWATFSHILICICFNTGNEQIWDFFVSFQTCNNHCGCYRRCGARPHPAGTPCLLPKKTEEAKEEGNTEEDPARTRGGGTRPT